MMDSHGSAGRGASRPAILGLLAVVAIGVGLGAARLVGGSPRRGPIAIPNPNATAPSEYVAGSVRHIETGSAPELLLPDSIPPSNPSRLLWFEGRAAHATAGDQTIVLDGAGGLLRFDRNLRVRRISFQLEGREPTSVAPAPDYGYWIVDGDGQLFLLDEFGMVVKQRQAPFPYATLRADSAGSEVWLARSPARWSYTWADPTQPLLLRLSDPGGDGAFEPVGSMRIPEHVLLGELANAGHLAVSDDALYFAPFIRDEVVAMTRDGDTLWIAHRGLPQSVDEPKILVEDGEPEIDYAPVNLGIAIGPDDRLYVSSIPGFTTAESRLDVFERRSGRLLRTAVLDTPLPTLSVDGAGRVYLLDPFRLLTGVAPAERQPFHPFALPLLSGGELSLDDLRGKVVLVNFWASWCAPCREEMPALDSLQKGIEDPEFAFITMNEDVNAAQAEAFISEFAFQFPVALGGGKLKADYHYLGLPFTVLLDRDGREVQRWIGFAGPDQIRVIRSVIDAELARGEGTPGEMGGHRH